MSVVGYIPAAAGSLCHRRSLACSSNSSDQSDVVVPSQYYTCPMCGHVYNFKFHFLKFKFQFLNLKFNTADGHRFQNRFLVNAAA